MRSLVVAWTEMTLWQTFVGHVLAAPQDSSARGKLEEAVVPTDIAALAVVQVHMRAAVDTAEPVAIAGSAEAVGMALVVVVAVAERTAEVWEHGSRSVPLASQRCASPFLE